MIKGCTRNFRRVLRLASYGAARRFAAIRSGSPGQRNEWLPIVLRWRRRHRSAKEVTARSNPVGSRVSYFPQFHFHYVSHIHAGANRKHSAGLVPVASPGECRTVIHDRSSMISNCTAAMPGHDVWLNLPRMSDGRSSKTTRSNPAMPVLITVGSRNRARPKENRTSFRIPQASWLASDHDSAKRRPSNPFVAGWPVTQTVTRPLEVDAERLGTLPGEGHTQFLQRHSHIWHQHHRVATTRRPAPKVVRPRRSVTADAFRFQQPPPEELIWRRVPAGRSNGSDEADDPIREPVDRTRTQPRQQASDDSPVSPITETAPPLQQLTKLDPALLDRLTDTIISRVEKRIKIEHERRGL
jgi:hypothetical protein